MTSVSPNHELLEAKAVLGPEETISFFTAADDVIRVLRQNLGSVIRVEAGLPLDEARGITYTRESANVTRQGTQISYEAIPSSSFNDSYFKIVTEHEGHTVEVRVSDDTIVNFRTSSVKVSQAAEDGTPELQWSVEVSGLQANNDMSHLTTRERVQGEAETDPMQLLVGALGALGTVGALAKPE